MDPNAKQTPGSPPTQPANQAAQLPFPLQWAGAVDRATGQPLVRFPDPATGQLVLARQLPSKTGQSLLVDMYGRVFGFDNVPQSPPTPPPPSTPAAPSPAAGTSGQDQLAAKGKSSKGILKPTRSFEYRMNRDKLKWDEDNILKTFHPPDKDYGFMKVKDVIDAYNYGAGQYDEGGYMDLSQLFQTIPQCTTDSDSTGVVTSMAAPAASLEVPRAQPSTAGESRDTHEAEKLRRRRHDGKKGRRTNDDDDYDDSDE